jgi:ABC-type uncharacterized transport system permease subunit
MLVADIRRCFKVFTTIYSARLGKDFSLPLASQIFSNLGSLCFFTLHIISFSLLINKFSFPGWSRPDMWVLLFTFEIFTYLAFFLFWKGFQYTIKDINTGAFDLILSKPFTSLFITIFRGGGLHNLLAVLLGSVSLAFVIVIYQIPVSISSIFGFLVSLGLSLFTFMNLSVSLISLNFKYGRITGTAYAGFQIQEVYKYPSTAYSGYQIPFLILLACFSLLTTFPAAALIQKKLDLLFILIYFSFSFIMFVVSRITWTKSLAHYSSAGS